jgi:hypothetical protein
MTQLRDFVLAGNWVDLDGLVDQLELANITDKVGFVLNI